MATAAAIACLPALSQTAQPPSADEVTLAIIVVSSAEEAQRISDRLKRGEDFATIAEAESIDASANRGGFLGSLALSQLRPELRSALQGVGPGQISPVVRLPTGFAILTVVPETRSTANMNASPADIPALAATGSVRYTLGVDGVAEANMALDRYRKPVNWNQDPRTICEIRKESFSALRTSLEDFLSPANLAGGALERPIDLVQAYVGLAQVNMYEGRMDPAIEQLQHAYRIAVSDMPAVILQLEETLGVAYLHQSEMENGVYHAPGERCLLPMRPGQAYAKTSGSEKAIEHFLRYLDQNPDELEVKWLLNLAYMTLGAYPDKVPQKYLIPTTAFGSTENVPRFVDVAPQAGLNVFAMAGGVIVDDFDHDGHLDVVTSSFENCGAMHFFRNNRDGTFTDRAARAGLSDQLGGLNILQADYNNDGCVDILVLRGGWELPQRNSLLRNSCNGTFTDVTDAAGLAVPATSTQTAVWTDINHDGLLDFFVGNEDRASQLFLNEGDGTFQDIARSAGVDRSAFSKGVAAADYDNDGYTDLYVSNLTGDNFLYHNNHDNTFTEVARAAGVPGSGRGFATWFFDYDNDGSSDLFVTSFFTSVDETVRTYLGLPHNATTLKLYKNVGNGTFRDVTIEVGLDRVFMPMGANFGDIDDDGFLDIYLGTGNPSYAALVPNVLLRNKEGKSFVDVTASSGTGELHKGHGIAFADLDNDGDEDIVAEIGGAAPADKHALRLFENPGHDNDWISLKLTGVKTNRAAVGARIKVTVENEGQGIRAIHRTVGSGGSFGASPLQQHIGLGKSARILDLEISWPTSNTRQHFSSVGKNQFLEIAEFAQDYAKLNRPLSRLGGAKRDERAPARLEPGSRRE